MSWNLHHLKTFLFIRSKFLISNDPSYGNCFTFNTALNNQDPMGGNSLSAITGPKLGLNLIINVEQSKEFIICDVKIFFFIFLCTLALTFIFFSIWTS